MHSTLAAETSALVDALNASYFVSYIFHEIINGGNSINSKLSLGCVRNLMPLIAFTDNNSVSKCSCNYDAY